MNTVGTYGVSCSREYVIDAQVIIISLLLYLPNVDDE